MVTQVELREYLRGKAANNHKIAGIAIHTPMYLNQDNGSEIQSYYCYKFEGCTIIWVNPLIMDAENKVFSCVRVFAVGLKSHNQLLAIARHFSGLVSYLSNAATMVEAGKIIHMLDTNVIQDLRFVSHQFSNDANGKMLLGMLFVFAKHYSDDLSAKVTRGVKGNLGEGKSGGTPKHGYIREENGLYQPDGKHFDLMRQAWAMRAEGQSLDTIATYLNDHGYARYVKKLKGHSDQPMKPNVLEYVFKDTFYFGVLNQTSQSVDLLELGLGFKPMINRDTYYKAQQFSTAFKRGAAKKHPVYLPLRHLVFCGVCSSETPMIAGKSKGRQGKHYLYYRCGTKGCQRLQKSVRGKVLFNELQTIIESKVGALTYAGYESYLKEVRTYTNTQKSKVRGDLSSYKVVKSGHETSRLELVQSLARLKDKAAIDDTHRRIAELSGLIDDLQDKMAKANTLLVKSELPVVSRDEFSELAQKTGKKLLRGDKFQKDKIIRDLFLKLWIDDEKVATYLWKEPYLSLIKATDFQTGGGAWT